jgi:hypothetical protein
MVVVGTWAEEEEVELSILLDFSTNSGCNSMHSLLVSCMRARTLYMVSMAVSK